MRIFMVFLGVGALKNPRLRTQKRIVVNTWPFTEANVAAWDVLKNGGSALDAVTAGTSRCEALQCDGSVGWGNHPDENGEVTLDAMIMDGQTANVGAVGGLRRVKDAAKVARHVLDNTVHTLLVGDMATEFALKMGFKNESLSSPTSEKEQSDWLKNNCQPNYWANVTPDPKSKCGPYQPIENPFSSNDVLNKDKFQIGENNHDTIGIVAFDQFGKSAAGTTTNGMIHKIPGRVGDSPIPGAGSYINEAGGCAATGDGDVMMRFLPCYQAVENLRLGMNPRQAALDALHKIVRKYDSFVGAVITVASDGNFGAACHNINNFPFVVTADDQATKTFTVPCSTTINDLMSMLKTAWKRHPRH